MRAVYGLHVNQDVNRKRFSKPYDIREEYRLMNKTTSFFWHFRTKFFPLYLIR